MIPASLNFAIYAAFILTALFPILLLLFLILRRQVNTLPLLVGALAFFVLEILLRVPVVQSLAVRWPAFVNMLPAWFLFVSLCAGLFVESGRLLVRKMLPNYNTFKDALSFGLGFGLCEVVLLAGLSNYNYILLSMAASGSYVIAPDVAAPEQVMSLIATLAALSPWHIFLGVLECFSKVVFHIFASVLIFAGVNRGQSLKYWLLAVIIHTLFSYTGLMLMQYTNVWLAQLVVLALALIMGKLVLDGRLNFPLAPDSAAPQQAAAATQTPEKPADKTEPPVE